jgi:hypothetical protein
MEVAVGAARDDPMSGEILEGASRDSGRKGDRVGHLGRGPQHPEGDAGQ